MPSERASLLLTVCLLAAACLALPAASGGSAAGGGILAPAPTPDGSGFEVATAAYTAVVDARHGNLASLANARGDVLLGGGRINGVAVAWGGSLAQPGGAEAEVRADGETVVVTHAAYEMVYSFGAEEVTVTVTPTAAADVLRPVTLVAASIPEPSREAAMRFSKEAYLELGAYPTDYWTDSSNGQFSLWTTAVYSVGGHTYRGAMLKPTLDGLCRWETGRGQVVFDRADGHAAGLASGSPLYRETCGLDNATGLEVAGAVLVPTTHQVVQTFDGLAAGSILSFTIAVNDHGYDVEEVLYPVSTRVTAGANTGLTSAKLVIPHSPQPAAGHPLVVYMPGHWDELYTHSYLWDFLANHGYMVAVPFTTADMGDGHQRDDWGYMSQTEADELRQWVTRTYGIDRDRVYTAGLSLGGLNALLNAINHPDAYAATIYYSGVYDFVRFWATPLGLASFPLNVEAPLCCGDPVNNPYEYAIRSPRERIGQFQGGLFIVQGAADAVAPPDHAIELSTAVPGSILHIGQGAHENNVFAGFRKEALEFLRSQPPRPLEQRNSVDLLVYGTPEFIPVGFERPAERRNYTNEWMTVWVEDGVFTHVQGEVRPFAPPTNGDLITAGGYRVTVDRPATAEFRRPAWCQPLCAIRDTSVPGTAWNADQTAVQVELTPGTPAEVNFLASSPDPVPVPDKESSGLGLAMALTSLALVALARRRRA